MGGLMQKGLGVDGEQEDLILNKTTPCGNMSVFEKIQTYLINHFGAMTSLTSMLKELSKSGMNIKKIHYFEYR